MTSESQDRLREMQHQIELAARTAGSRQDLMNYRALWGSLQVVLDNEQNGE